MPRKRRVSKHREDISEDAESWLHGEECGFFRFKRKEELAALWAKHGDRIVAEHIALYPGARPERWWQYDAPEPRQRFGGVGTPSHECLGYVPNFSYGIPAAWISHWDVEYYTGTARDIHGNLINPKPSGTFKGVATDPNDPPVYESQASYLERHDLLPASERQRLTKEDFEPEQIDP